MLKQYLSGSSDLDKKLPRSYRVKPKSSVDSLDEQNKFLSDLLNNFFMYKLQRMEGLNNVLRALLTNYSSHVII